MRLELGVLPFKFLQLRIQPMPCRPNSNVEELRTEVLFVLLGQIARHSPLLPSRRLRGPRYAAGRFFQSGGALGLGSATWWGRVGGLFCEHVCLAALGKLAAPANRPMPSTTRLLLARRIGDGSRRPITAP